MTFATALLAGAGRIRATLVIDGIPVVFGTQAGIAHDSVGVTNPAAGLMTSVLALTELPKLDGAKLDKDVAMVSASKLSISIKLDDSYNKWFERRRTPSTFLTANLSTSATSLTVADTTGMDGDQVIYVDREAILIGNVASATSLTSCTRGYMSLSSSSGPAQHFGGGTVGIVTPVGSTPRHLLGRQVQLRIYAGDSDSADYQDLGTMRLVASPRCNKDKGVWELELEDNLSFFDRKVAVGMKGAKIQSATLVNPTVGNVSHYRFQVDDPTEFTGSWLGYVVLTRNDDSPPFLVPVQSFPSGDIQVLASYFIDDEEQVVPAGGFIGGTCKRVMITTDWPMWSLLHLMLSRNGDNTNHAIYDSMWGLTTEASTIVAGQSERRFGAAIPAAMVDVTTLATFANMPATGWVWMVGARGEENLMECMEEAAWALGGFFYQTAAGILSFKLYEAAYPQTGLSTAVTDDDLGRDSPIVSLDDESSVLHTVLLDCNISPVDDKAYAHFTSVFAAQKELYRDANANGGGTLKLSRKGMWVEVPGASIVQPFASKGFTPPSVPIDVVSQRMQRIFVRRAFGTRKYELHLPLHKFINVVPGDRLSLTSSLLNAFDGSTGPSAMLLEVVERGEVDWDAARIIFQAEEIPAGKLIAPVMRVASWASPILTLSTNTLWGGTTIPAYYLRDGWEIELHDRSSSPAFSTVHTSVVTVTGLDNITLASIPAFTPVAGDLVCMRAYDNASATTTNNAQGVSQRDYAFMADTNFQLGAANEAAHKWG